MAVNSNIIGFTATPLIVLHNELFKLERNA